METNSGNKLDKLSSLSARLIEVEREHVKCDDGTEVDARQDLMDALVQYHSSRFRLGKALAAYKVFFAEERAWMQAAELIAQAIGHDERTVRRILADYERVSQLPIVVVEEFEAQGKDPAAMKNAPVVASVLAMPPSEVEARPKEAVTQAVNAVMAAKAAKVEKMITMDKASLPDTTDEMTVLAPLTCEEKQRYAIRLKIRAAWARIPNEKKLEELFSALVEEMHDALGMREAITITLTPRPSALTLDGLQRLEVAA